ncbi:MAG: sulfatase [Gloeobacteraceae cyanobacterium ES-bin-144]|nr:sulfatase [Verrucomicrobiales bacterium]
MSSPEEMTKTASLHTLKPVLGGISAFLTIQYGIALWSLSHSTGAMANKFSALARDQYIGFLVGQNLLMLVAYVILAVIATLLVQPIVTIWTQRSKHRKPIAITLRSFLIVSIMHGFCTLRLIKTRPYFLNEEEFGRWYFKILDGLPDVAQPTCLFILFTLLPLIFITLSLAWHTHRHGRKGWAITGVLALIGMSCLGIQYSDETKTFDKASASKPTNIIIIGSDSLRGDRLGFTGYRPQRNDGPAAAGVSPAIDAFAEKSAIFERCYTSIASTMESGVQLMSSQYPQSHGIRQMYPDRETVEATKKRIVPIASLFRERGYDTAVIGDWCAGYYDVIPLGFEHISASSFDNFKIYMSQAVVMAHFVIPLYFDNPLGYRIFPQLQSFAQFVTPNVVTDRVEQRLAKIAKDQKPFFWHVFYSCNHLPYRSREPFVSMFTDPAYQGRNKSGVDFDIDSFIGGTDLESKWKALPPREVAQIRALYDGCTRQFDECVEKILAAIKRNGLEDNTIIIVTSDHGDDHYEPGVTLGHGLTFNGGDQANHVPMIIHVPGQTAKRFPETIRMIDVIPTLADFTGIEKSTTWQGQSVANWIRGTAPPEYRPFYGETGFPFIQFTVPGVVRPELPPMDELTWIDEDYNYQFVVKPEYLERLAQAKQRCLRTKNWKLVCTPTASGTRHYGLFNIATDTDVVSDVAATRPEILAPMKAALERWMDEKVESSIKDIFPGGEPQ